jgi:hypothetical protein
MRGEPWIFAPNIADDAGLASEQGARPPSHDKKQDFL